MENFLEFHLKRMDLVQNREHSNQIITRPPTAMKTFKKQLRFQKEKGDYIIHD